MLEKVNNTKALLEKVKWLFDEAVAADGTWQMKAKESFAFRDGPGQWDKIEREILEEERRPALTLNVVKAHIDLIMGLNEDLKKRHICSPVSPEDAFLCEVINNVIYWLYQKNDWEGEEDNAYESALISGRGWVNIDFDVDERKVDEIKITQTSIPVHEVRFDPAARKRDLSDASYIVWDRWLSLEDFAIKYPSHAKKAEQAFEWGVWPRMDIELPAEANNAGNDINDESDYSDPLDIGYFDSKKRQIRVCHMEYWKYVKKYFYWDYERKEWLEAKGKWEDFQKEFAKAYPGKRLQYEQSTQKEVWWLQFCGEEVLVHAKSPINYPGFSLVPCFLYGDVSRRHSDHFGIVELMKDPQREINKRTSQTLNLFNQQVQPGVYAEAQAFLNTDQAEQSLKEPGSITWLKDGAIGQKRLQERQVPVFPTAVLQMGEYSREMIRHITGINPDLLGMNDKRREAGIVVQLRQQQGMAILKPVFKAYMELRKQLFERQVRIIMEHMPIKQIKKILGEGDRYKITGNSVIEDTKTGLACNLRNVSEAAYDIDAEPEANTLTQNALEMATFMEMQQAGMPVDPKVIVGKTNLPMTEKLKWLSYIDEQQKMASEAAQAEVQMKQQEIQMKHEREMKKIEYDFQLAQMKLGDARTKDQLKVATDQEKLRAQVARDEQTAQLKLMQIIIQAQQGAEEAKRKAVEMILDADHDRKRLLLDTVEVMAMARMAGDKLKVQLVMDMYKEAMKASTVDKQEEGKLLGKVMDMLANVETAKMKAEVDMKKAEKSGGNDGTGKTSKPKPS